MVQKKEHKNGQDRLEKRNVALRYLVKLITDLLKFFPDHSHLEGLIFADEGWSYGTKQTYRKK